MFNNINNGGCAMGKPWPVNIHKVIATKLGLKTSEVYKAISLIVKEDTED